MMWRISAASWTPPTGRTAAPPPARNRRMVKRNEQLPPDSEVARKLGNRVLSALTASPQIHLGGDPAADLSAAI